MKKIGLFLTHDRQTGGHFQYGQTMLEAVNALPRDEFSVVVACTSIMWLDYLKKYQLETVFVEQGFWSRALGKVLREVGFPLRLWRKLSPFFHPTVKALLQQNCDLWIFPSQSRWNCQIPVPALACIHDLMHRYEPRFPVIPARELEWLSRNMCTYCTGIIVDSDVGKQHVKESYGTSEDRIYVLPFIAPKYIYSQEPAKNDYELPEKFIFYPAQFWEHKNQKNLISACAMLKKDLPDLKLVLAGIKRNGYQALMNQIRELHLVDDVIFLGYVPDEDMASVYRRARAMVMPTFFGPTNIPPLEAFAAGCPVAISGIYGMPEQVGDAALLFDPNSVDEIADCIKRLWLYDDLCIDLAIKGKLKAATWGQQQFNARVKEIIELSLEKL